MTWKRWRLLSAVGLVSLSTFGTAGCTSFAGGTSEEVVIEGGGGIALRGTLIIPEARLERMAAVVLLHGAEPATRKRLIYKLDSRVFLDRQMAVLVYDKRGAGESEGDHDAATYKELVEDAVAAVAFLRARPEIDPERVGVLGASESGWLTPEIAERSQGLAFVINKSGPPLSFIETNTWEVYNELLDAGVGEESARQQSKLHRRILTYYKDPTASERVAIERELESWRGRKDFRLSRELREDLSLAVKQNISYDPKPFLERTQTPFLYLFGRTDVNVPTEESTERLRELALAGVPVSFFVFEQAGHELGRISPIPPFFKLLEGYPEKVGSFAQTHSQ